METVALTGMETTLTVGKEMMVVEDGTMVLVLVDKILVLEVLVDKILVLGVLVMVIDTITTIMAEMEIGTMVKDGVEITMEDSEITKELDGIKYNIFICCIPHFYMFFT